MKELTPDQKFLVDIQLSTLRKFSCKGVAIPPYMHSGIAMYAATGLRPGGFLEACLKNDLRGAAECADDINFHCLAAYVGYFYNHLPSPAWGSPEKVEKWIDQHLGYMERSSE